MPELAEILNVVAEFVPSVAQRAFRFLQGTLKPAIHRRGEESSEECVEEQKAKPTSDNAVYVRVESHSLAALRERVQGQLTLSTASYRLILMRSMPYATRALQRRSVEGSYHKPESEWPNSHRATRRARTLS